MNGSKLYLTVSFLRDSYYKFKNMFCLNTDRNRSQDISYKYPLLLLFVTSLVLLLLFIFKIYFLGH